MDKNKLWENFLNNIKSQLSSIAFDTWFSETELYSLEDNVAKVIVPMHIHKKNLKENYNEIIEDIFTEISGSNFKFEYYLKEELESNIKIDTDDIGVPKNLSFETNLNSQYTFENFIVGESNKFAHATALAVAENPGYMYNPLFIYGNSGLGKTHLMHAIGNYIHKNSSKTVLYVTSEKFVSDFIGINKKNKEGNNFDNVEIFKNITFKDKIQLLALTVFSAGTLGNTIERLRFGYVVYYIKLNFIKFPVFNAFDIMICIGICLYCFYLFFDRMIFFI